MTAVRCYHAPDGTFRKILPAEQARRELVGRRLVAGLLPVPRLLDIRATGDGCEIVYEDVFASGRCTGLLADCINTADRNPATIPVVRSLVNQVCDHLLATVAAAGVISELGTCVPDLHLARLTPGSRLDRWYTRAPQPIWQLGRQRLGPADLASRTLVACGQELGPGWPVDLPALRSVLARHGRWVCAVTQGDVTEPNIAQPLCWLDFEHAGRNALASDSANFLWYLLGMGGWLVPAYQPDVYARTLRAPLVPIASPVINHLRVSARNIEIGYVWQVGQGRHAALTTLLHRLVTDLGAALAPGGGLAATLRPFLALRILGVIPLAQMSGAHALVCLAKLAELTQPAWSLHAWCATSPVAIPLNQGGGLPPGRRICDGD